MSNYDKLERFIFENSPVRGEYVHLVESFQTIVNQHAYPAPLKQLLGEALCVASLLSAIIKFNGRLTVQFRGNGKLKLLLAQCDNHSNLRGLVKWDSDSEMTYADLMASFNDGILAIMLDGTERKSHYQGVVSWQGNSFAESIEGYFKNSEQLATKIWLAVNETSAVGFLLQVIPGSTAAGSSAEKEIVYPHWDRINQLTTKLYPIDLLSMDYTALLRMLYPDEVIRVFPPVDMQFGCTCSRKRSADAILLLGREEAEAELQDKQSIVVTCDFCNREYIFDRVDITKLFEDKNSPPKDSSIH